jgi:hypothetical protein
MIPRPEGAYLGVRRPKRVSKRIGSRYSSGLCRLRKASSPKSLHVVVC